MVSDNWGKQGKIETKDLPKGAEDKIISEDTLKEKLEAMKMPELRAYVKQHNLKAKDTDKDELIAEILEEVSN